MASTNPDRRWQHPLPTMYDLPSEDPEEPGLPDQFHELQPRLLSLTCQPSGYPVADCFMAQDLNLYYDPRHTQWYKRPDWFLVLGAQRVEQQDELRWSYVVWQEGVMPFLVVELLSPGTEAEDLGQTLRAADRPPTKWQVYEHILQVPFYALYDRYQQRFRLFQLEGGRYRELGLPERRFWFERLGLGLGVWSGRFAGVTGQWLRWYDEAGEWIPTPEEQAEQERQRAEQALATLNSERQERFQAVTRLLAMGLSAAQVAAVLSLSVEQVAALAADAPDEPPS